MVFNLNRKSAMYEKEIVVLPHPIPKKSTGY